jgi:hypothetical protein
MYNSNIPTQADLPTYRQLLHSTIIAILSAATILVTVVLPAEYNIDPTGIGRVLGLAEMGEIKQQLSEEAEQDRLLKQQPEPAKSSDQESSLGQMLINLFITSAHAQEANSGARTDTLTLTLKPGEGTEVKLAMLSGAKVNFTWTVEGGVVNFDMHGDGGGNEISYEKGRAVPGAEGVLEAKFDGNHGWFWRNRGKADVVVTLNTVGDYSDIKKVM